MSEQNKTLARRFAEEAFSKGDEAVLEETCSPDIVDHNPFGRHLHGIEGARYALRHFRSAFPDARYWIEDLLADGDKVIIRGRLTGTQTGELMGFPASGKPIDIKIIDIYRCAEGKLVERWGVFEGLLMATQIGMVQPPQL